MRWDGIGFSAPLLDPSKSKVTEVVGFAPEVAGKVRNCATFIDGIGIPATAKNQKAAWLFVQWATGKEMLGRSCHRLRHPGAAVGLCAPGHHQGQQVPAGMVRHHGHQPEDARVPGCR